MYFAIVGIALCTVDLVNDSAVFVDMRACDIMICVSHAVLTSIQCKQ